MGETHDGFEFITHKNDAEVASDYRWYLRINTITSDILTQFGKEYSDAARAACEKDWKRRLYVDLSTQGSTISPKLLIQAASIITSNRPYTGKVYESVIILIPEAGGLLSMAIQFVVSLVPDYNAPIMIFKNKRAALAYHMSAAQPAAGIQFV